MLQNLPVTTVYLQHLCQYDYAEIPLCIIQFVHGHCSVMKKIIRFSNLLSIRKL